MKHYDFVRVQAEVPVDPESAFWIYHTPTDDNGDPLDLLCRCEDGDEVALEIVSCLNSTRKYELHAHPVPKNGSPPFTGPSTDLSADSYDASARISLTRTGT
jgi:hypothetical protein